MRIFLKLKHWQLFIPMGLALIPFQMLMNMAYPGASPQDAIPIAIVLGILIVVNCIILVGWTYAVATFLHRKLPEAVPMNLTRFKIFFFIPLLYTLSVIITVPLFILNILHFRDFNLAFLLLIIPMHLFCIFCAFYCIYFNAKSLKAVEVQGPLKSDAFVGEFFLIWYFIPIGVWFLQPRLNKLVAQEEQQQFFTN